MARPKVHHEQRVTTAIRLSRDLHERLTEAARDRQLAVNHLVVLAVEDFLERLIPAEELKLTRG